MQAPLEGIHQDLHKIFWLIRISARSSYKDLYKVLAQGSFAGLRILTKTCTRSCKDLLEDFPCNWILTGSSYNHLIFLEPNVHTCPQDIFLYLITWLAFHYWYPSNCSSSFLDAGFLSHVRDAKQLEVGYTTVIVATQSEVWQINALSCQPPQCP